MVCLYSTTISDVLENDAVVSDFRRFLSRSTYCEDDCRILAAKSRDFSPQAVSTEGNSDSLGQSLESLSRQKSIELPENWYEMFQGWAKSFEAYARKPDPEFQYFKSICDPQRLTPFEKMSFFEVMRFCHILSPKLLSGWRLVFERGKKIANVNIRLYPNWLPTELQGLPLFPITPNEKYSSGFIWFNAPPDSKFREQQEGTPLWHFYKIKLDMKSKLPKAYIYEDGMVERLISLLDESADKLIDAGLVSEAVSEGAKVKRFSSF